MRTPSRGTRHGLSPQAEFFGNAFWHGLDGALLARGWHIAYNASPAGLYGSPRAVANWSAILAFILEHGPAR